MTTHHKARQKRHLTTEHQHRTVTIIIGHITNCQLQQFFFISTCIMSYETDRQHNLDLQFSTDKQAFNRFMIYQNFQTTAPICIIWVLCHYGHNAMYYITRHLPNCMTTVTTGWSSMHCIPHGYINYISYLNTNNLSHVYVLSIIFTRVSANKETFISLDNVYWIHIWPVSHFLLSAISVCLK
jgi:hypothetical protein